MDLGIEYARTLALRGRKGECYTLPCILSEDFMLEASCLNELYVEKIDYAPKNRRYCVNVDRTAASLMIMPRIQLFTKKNPNDASHKPGKNVVLPKNSSW